MYTKCIIYIYLNTGMNVYDKFEVCIGNIMLIFFLKTSHTSPRDMG